MFDVIKPENESFYHGARFSFFQKGYIPTSNSYLSQTNRSLTGCFCAHCHISTNPVCNSVLCSNPKIFTDLEYVVKACFTSCRAGSISIVAPPTTSDNV